MVGDAPRIQPSVNSTAISSFEPGKDGPEGCESAFFVDPNQLTVAGDISCEDGGQPTFDASPRSRRIEKYFALLRKLS
jgi:hypothetical protein